MKAKPRLGGMRPNQPWRGFDVQPQESTGKVGGETYTQSALLPRVIGGQGEVKARRFVSPRGCGLEQCIGSILT